MLQDWWPGHHFPIRLKLRRPKNETRPVRGFLLAENDSKQVGSSSTRIGVVCCVNVDGLQFVKLVLDQREPCQGVLFNESNYFNRSS